MRHLSTLTKLVPALVVLAWPLVAQEHAHGAATERLGTVHFATSCRAATAPTFDRGVALLHSFEFGASIRAFNDVLAVDSTCAMAHWGLALSRWSNPMSAGARTPAMLQPGRVAAESATRLAAGATERERGYISAVSQLYSDYEHRDQRSRISAYERAMAGLVAAAPADTEARIFHALALVAAAPPTDKSYANQIAAGTTLEQLWERQPNHPGLAHYIIHAYDVPALAGRASAAAQRYARIAPSAAHALHMPSHTFTRVGMWKESIETNLRSAAEAKRSGAMSEALHASDYAVYAYLQLQRDAAAKAIVDSLPAYAARFDANAVTGAAPGSAGVFALAAIPARYAVERRDWRMAASLRPTTSAFPYTEALTWFARALGAAHTGDVAGAHVAIDSLATIRDRLLAQKESYWAEQVAIQRLGAQAWLDVAEHHPDSALAHMREAATREDATEKSAVTPGPLAPAHELMGDLLMELGKPAEALAEYRATLAKEPGRYRALDGAKRAAAQRAGSGHDGYVTTPDSARLYYRVAGTRGDTIIAIHGGPGVDLESIAGDFAPLAERHVVIFYDQRGTGRSTLPRDTTTLNAEQQVRDLEAVRRHFALSTVTLVAHSYGPLLAATYAIAHPAVVRRMVFFGPVPPRRGEFWTRFGKAMTTLMDSTQRGRIADASRRLGDSTADARTACRDYWSVAMRPRLAEPDRTLPLIKSDLCASDPAGIRYGLTTTNRVVMGSYGAWDLRAALATVPAPTLIVHGENEAIPMDLVEEWTRALPHASLLRVPRAAHFTYAERPELVWPAVERFLAGGQ